MEEKAVLVLEKANVVANPFSLYAYFEKVTDAFIPFTRTTNLLEQVHFVV
jgi:hypothetical protein